MYSKHDKLSASLISALLHRLVQSASQPDQQLFRVLSEAHDTITPKTYSTLRLDMNQPRSWTETERRG
jgi:hypothetical protein